jgi:hypothetical protein
VAFVDEERPDFSNRRSDQAFRPWRPRTRRSGRWCAGFGATAESPENRERAKVIGDVTTRTGGRSSMVFDGTALKVRFADVATQLLSQFAVIYGRPESLIPPERLDVKLTNSELRLAAPRWTGK